MSENDLKKQIAKLQSTVEQQNKLIQEYEFIIESANNRIEHILRQLKDDVSRLQALQKTLVPNEIKKIPGMEFSSRFIPGSKMGGDYFDVFPIRDTQSFGVILSASGNHGISALILSILVATSPRLELTLQYPLEETTQKIIDSVKMHLKPEDEWHFLCGIFDKSRLLFRFFQFGGIQLAFQSHKKNPFEEVFPAYSAITSDITINSLIPHEIQLNPSGRIIIASPGLVFDPQSSQRTLATTLNQNNFTQEMHIHDFRNQLFHLSHRITGAQPSRDQTLIVAQVKDRAIRLAT